jgi:hypothetical protein
MAENINSTNIRDAVLRELGEGAASLSEHISYYFNQVLRDIARFHRWKWLESIPLTLTTDTGLNTITIPTYINRILSFYQADGGEEITYKSDDEYARLAALNSNAVDHPNYVNIQGDMLRFWPPLKTAGSVVVTADISGERLEDTGDIDGVKTTIPASYGYIIETGILARLDHIDNKKKWLDIYFVQLEIATKEDIKNKAQRIKATMDKVIDGCRVYYNAT